jgi:1,4-dihydroxy-6-naphthoate synthase
MVDEIRVGHTPDADDAFMFYAIENELIPMNNFKIVHHVEDIEKLNKRAINHELEITAISAHALAYLDKYTILISGGSFGINYGPIIVSKEKNSLDEISNGIIGIPGYMTSAYLLMTISLGKQKCKEFLFSDIPNAVFNNLVDYGLIIHESQITYKSQKLQKLFDLGEWWYKTSGGLPVPLGINVASNKLMNISRIRDFDELLKNSIQYSLDHPEEAIKFASKYGRGTQKSVLTEFVKMYVNEFTLDMKIQGKNSITKLFGLANEKGIIEKNVPLNYSR